MTTLPLAFVATELCLIAIFIKFYYSVRTWPFAFAAAVVVEAAIVCVVRAFP